MPAKTTKTPAAPTLKSINNKVRDAVGEAWDLRVEITTKMMKALEVREKSTICTLIQELIDDFDKVSQDQLLNWASDYQGLFNKTVALRTDCELPVWDFKTLAHKFTHFHREFLDARDMVKDRPSILARK